jgi:hypothetical protein
MSLSSVAKIASQKYKIIFKIVQTYDINVQNKLCLTEIYL